MNLNKIKLTMATGVLAASMILPSMTAFAVDATKPVEVVDNNGSNSIITKTIQSPDGVSYSNESFTYEFEQDGYEGTGAGKTFKGNTTDSGVTANKKEATISTVTINEMSSTAATDVKNAAGEDQGYNTLSKSGSVDLSALDEAGVYTYTVTETKRSTDTDDDGVSDVKGTVWKYDTTTYKLRVYVTNKLDENGKVVTDDNGNAVLEKKMTIVDSSVTSNVDGAKVKSAEFINKVTERGGSDGGTDKGNTPDPAEGDKASLTIEKKVSDPTYEKDGQDYTFTVTFVENNLNKDTNGLNKTNTYEYYKVDAEGNRSTTATTITNGGTITLKNGEKAEFYKIYAGTKVTVAESDVTNLSKVSAAVTSNGGTLTTTELTKADDKYTTSQFLIGEKTNSAVFTNTYSDVTVTGVVTNIAPYVTLVVAAVLAVVAYMGLKNRLAR